MAEPPRLAAAEPSIEAGDSFRGFMLMKDPRIAIGRVVLLGVAIGCLIGPSEPWLARRVTGSGGS